MNLIQRLSILLTIFASGLAAAGPGEDFDAFVKGWMSDVGINLKVAWKFPRRNSELVYDRNTSEREMAARVGVSQYVFAQVRRGMRPITLSMARDVAAVQGRDLDLLLKVREINKQFPRGWRANAEHTRRNLSKHVSEVFDYAASVLHQQWIAEKMVELQEPPHARCARLLESLSDDQIVREARRRQLWERIRPRGGIW